MCAVKQEQEDDTLKDELAQEYRMLQTQQMMQQPPASTDVILRKKPSARGLKKFFGKYDLNRHFLCHLSFKVAVLLGKRGGSRSV